MERTASDRSMVLYSYPPNLGEAGRDEIDGIELIEVDVCYTTSDGKLFKTLLNVSDTYTCVWGNKMLRESSMLSMDVSQPTPACSLNTQPSD